MLSVIVPVYNEGANIEEFLRALQIHISPPYETLIVYDRDDDDTLAALNALKIREPQICATVRAVKNTVHRGPSGALRSGFTAALGDEVLVTMADLSDDLSQVSEMRRWLSSGYDLVCPSRYCEGGMQNLRSMRAFIPRQVGKCLRWLSGIPTFDPTNSYRIYSKQALRSFPLTSTHSFSVTLEIAAKAHCVGLRIKEIPTVWNIRKQGVSKFPFVASLATYLPWFLLALTNNRICPLPPAVRKRLAGLR